MFYEFLKILEFVLNLKKYIFNFISISHVFDFIFNYFKILFLLKIYKFGKKNKNHYDRQNFKKKSQKSLFFIFLN